MDKNMLRKALWEILRPLLQLITNLLNPESGEFWLTELKRFLRKEPCWERKFNPATFIGKSWSFAGKRDSCSAAIGLLDDYSRAKLSTEWLSGQEFIDGEIRRRMILEDPSSSSLNCDHFLDLWNNKEKIPEEWKVVGLITFDGDVLWRSDGRRYVLYLCWNDGEWRWDYSWLDSKFDAYSPSAVIVS